MSDPKPYVFSPDGENFRGKDPEGNGWETRDEALAAGRSHADLVGRLKEADPGPVWTGCKVDCPADAFFPTTTHLIESMRELAQADVGENAVDDWLTDALDENEEDGPGAELKEFFEETFYPFLQEWVEKHELSPKFWQLTDVVKHADDDGAVDEGALQKS